MSSVLSENVSSSFCNYILVVFVCKPLYLGKLPQKSSIFKFFLWISLISYETYKIFSFIRKCLHILFQLCNNCICIPIVVSEIFQRKLSMLLVILSNPQFYHTYVRWKSSGLSQNMSSSFFNCILIVFVCLSLYLSFHFQKYIQI